MGRIRAVLFDCDGLMFNTEQIAQEVWAKEAKRYGIDLPDDFFIHITGAGGVREREYIRSVIPDEAIIAAISAKRFDLAMWASFPKGELVKKGLEELYAYLRQNGYRVGIASSSGREYVETLLNNTLKEIRYDAICTGDMVRYAKPDPEIFLRCAQMLGVPPEECLVLEDSRQGVHAAANAGMHAGFIQDTIACDSEMEQWIEYRFNDLSEVIGLLEEQGNGHVSDH